MDMKENDVTKLLGIEVTKEDIKNSIEKAIAEGVINGEEVDVTASKVLGKVWPLIQYLEDQYNDLVRMNNEATL